MLQTFKLLIYINSLKFSGIFTQLQSSFFRAEIVVKNMSTFRSLSEFVS